MLEQAFQPEAVAGRRPYVAAAAAEHEKDLVAVAAAASMEEPEKEAELEEDAVVAAPGAMLFPVRTDTGCLFFAVFWM